MSCSSAVQMQPSVLCAQSNAEVVSMYFIHANSYASLHTQQCVLDAVI